MFEKIRFEQRDFTYAISQTRQMQRSEFNSNNVQRILSDNYQKAYSQSQLNNMNKNNDD